MKALILILFVGIAAQAQTIADLARQERARQQARTQGARVLTNEDLKRPQNAAAAETQATAQAAATAPAQAKPQAASQAEAKPAATEPDPVKAWNDDIAALRVRIRDLQDQETATQLQINDLTNQVYAPVTSVKLRNDAQAALGAAQKKLTTIREEIIATRLKLEQLQARGPERK